MTWEIKQGNSLDLLAALEPETVQTVITSPPYWGLRDYGHPGQLGLDATPAEYVDGMVELFRGVRRALRPDGTLWLNLGDSYAGSWGNQGRKEERGTQRAIKGGMIQQFHNGGHRIDCDLDEDYTCSLDRYPAKASNTGKIPKGSGLKPKDLCGIPWRVALALQADGWWLRADIIWHKPSCMPSSVKDRPTTSHEYLFLLTRSARYYYDAEAIREPDSDGGSRNKRSVWRIATVPFPGSHFAVMPPGLVEPCIKAGSRPGDLVLDPFSGAATVGLVACRLQRRYLGLELNADYCEMGRRRIESDAPLFNRGPG